MNLVTAVTRTEKEESEFIDVPRERSAVSWSYNGRMKVQFFPAGCQLALSQQSVLCLLLNQKSLLQLLCTLNEVTESVPSNWVKHSKSAPSSRWRNLFQLHFWAANLLFWHFVTWLHPLQLEKHHLCIFSSPGRILHASTRSMLILLNLRKHSINLFRNKLCMSKATLRGCGQMTFLSVPYFRLLCPPSGQNLSSLELFC